MQQENEMDLTLRLGQLLKLCWGHG